MSQGNSNRIGVIGLGAMGFGVATAMLKAGCSVVGFDIDPKACEMFREQGGRCAESPAELAELCHVVVLVVVNADQVEEVLFNATDPTGGVVGRLAPGSVVVQCATVAPSYAITLGERLATHALLMLDAPISGGVAKARQGQLSVMASGHDEAFEKARVALDAMSEKVYRLGDIAGSGSSVKLVNQHLAGVHIAAAAEAIALGIRMGIDPETLYEVITHSAGNSWMFENRVPHILANNYVPLSAVDIFVKDLNLVHQTGRELTFPLPVASSALQLFTAASSAGFGREDDSAVIKVYQRLSGISLPAANDEPAGQ